MTKKVLIGKRNSTDWTKVASLSDVINMFCASFAGYRGFKSQGRPSGKRSNRRDTCSDTLPPPTLFLPLSLSLSLARCLCWSLRESSNQSWIYPFTVLEEHLALRCTRRVLLTVSRTEVCWEAPLDRLSDPAVLNKLLLICTVFPNCLWHSKAVVRLETLITFCTS